jgi:hypothetical protein
MTKQRGDTHLLPADLGPASSALFYQATIAILLCLALLGIALVFYSLDSKLSQRQQPEEITLGIKKLPEYSFKWRVCLKQYPSIRQHGKAHNCVRTDI